MGRCCRRVGGIGRVGGLRCWGWRKCWVLQECGPFGQDKVTIRVHGSFVVGIWGMGWGEGTKKVSVQNT